MRSTPVSDGVGPARLPERRQAVQLPAVQALRQVTAARPHAVTGAKLPVHETRHETGELFRRIRLIAGLSQLQLAQRLHTFPSVIDALERGEFDGLPSWPETVLVVSGFTALAGVDPRPALAAIREEIEGQIIDAQAAEVPANPARPAFARALIRAQSRPSFPPPNSSGEVAAPASLPRWHSVSKKIGAGHVEARRLTKSGLKAAGQRLSPVMKRAMALPVLGRVAPPWRMPVALSLAVTLSLAAVIVFGGSGTLQAAVSSLPQPLSGAYRSVEDYVLRSMATEKNGLVWIEVSDPRSRKTDKLPAPRR